MGRIITHSVLATTDNQVDTIYGAALELGCVEEAEDPRHRQLGHGQEERAEDRDGHHQIEVDQQIGSELREALCREGGRVRLTGRGGVKW